MAVLTDLASAEVKRTTTTLYGTTLTAPTLLMSDGVSARYVCDVNISPTDSTGQIKQYLNDKKDSDKTRGPAEDLITGIPGQPPEAWQLDDSLPGHIDTTLHNVPLAKNNAELRYADRGAPVVLTRDRLGSWEISGFSSQKPGTYKLYPVHLGDMTLGTMVDLSVSMKLLTLAELGEKQPFGILPFGAAAIYRGSELVRIG